MKKIISLGLFLAVVAGLSGAALSLVYNVTEPIIEEAAIASEKENLVKIYPSAQFKAIDTDTSEYPSIQGVYQAEGYGYIYKCSVSGYGGTSSPIIFLVALGDDGTYQGFEVLDCTGETKGYGSKVGDEDFKDSIVGQNIGDSIDTISGATISSSAVVNGIAEVTAHYAENFE